MILVIQFWGRPAIIYLFLFILFLQFLADT